MKKLLIALICCWMFAGCSVFKKNEKLGCKTSGKNVGAERILSGDKEAIKAAKRARKFKS